MFLYAGVIVLIAPTDMREDKKLEEWLSKEVEMNNLKAAKKIFGVEVERCQTNMSLFVSHVKYIENLKKFGVASYILV